MTWKTAMQVARGVLSGAGIVAGIAAVAQATSFGRTLRAYLESSESALYRGIQSQSDQAVSDALGASLVFYNSARLLLLFLGLAMLFAFGLLLVETLKQVPVDVLADSPGMDSLRRRVARAARRFARCLDPEEPPAPKPPIELVASDPPKDEADSHRQNQQKQA